jgi:aspartyl-tRNA(Asn)/glutamyl-tRNA(Gln) amidotransferase subunit C
MPLTEKDVRYVAELAHLELTNEEVSKFLPQLDSILQYIDKLNKLDEPGGTHGASQHGCASLYRPDEPEDVEPREARGTPRTWRRFFKVPRVIEREAACPGICIPTAS